MHSLPQPANITPTTPLAECLADADHRAASRALTSTAALTNALPVLDVHGLTSSQLDGIECAKCGVDLAYSEGERPYGITPQGQQLNACVPACEMADLPPDRVALARAVVTPDGVRAATALVVTEQMNLYATRGDDERAPAVRGLDILNAADDGIEDAAVAADAARQEADPRCTPRGEASDRYNHRLGRFLGRDMDRLFTACAEDAQERGEDPRKAVGQLRNMLSGYLIDAARDVIEARP